MTDVWAAGEAYEPYVGRWSRLVADRFLGWLDLEDGTRSLDVGSGTGALTGRLGDIGRATGVDRSAGFVGYAAHREPRCRFAVADATALPFADGRFDAVVSGLVLNFVPEPTAMVGEMARVARRQAAVALYVWDYAEGMQFMRYFWDAAAEVDPSGADQDEGSRFPLCAPGPLRALFTEAGLADVEVRDVVVPTVFTDFDDLWAPFLGGQGAAPAYLGRLRREQQDRIRETLAAAVPVEDDGRVALEARAWAVRGTA